MCCQRKILPLGHQNKEVRFWFFFSSHWINSSVNKKLYINIYTLVFSFRWNIYLSHMYSSAFMRAVRRGKLAFAFTDSTVGKRGPSYVFNKRELYCFWDWKNKGFHAFEIWRLVIRFYKWPWITFVRARLCLERRLFCLTRGESLKLLPGGFQFHPYK